MDVVVGHSIVQCLIFNFDPLKSGGATALPTPMVVTPLLTPENYCPISLMSKLLEVRIRNLLIVLLEKYCPLSDHQWGFTQGKSTAGALQMQLTNGIDNFGSRYLLCGF